MGFDIGKAKASRPREGFFPNPKLKLLGQVSEVMRFIKALQRAVKETMWLARLEPVPKVAFSDFTRG